MGRVARGVFRPGNVAWINREGKIAKAKVSAIFTFMGLEKVEVQEAEAGDIVALSGISDLNIGETLTDPEHPDALPVIEIEQPTVKMGFGVNTSPFAGEEGEYTTSRNIQERLDRELQNDVALKVALGDGDGAFIVSGRGELHLAILMENMRREGFEFQVSKPQVILREIDGEKQEPFEEVSIECPESMSGAVIEKLGKRKAEMKDMRVDSGQTYLEFEIPTRGLIGYRAEFMKDTRGQGILNTIFLGYRPYLGTIDAMPHGSLIAHESGTAMTHGLVNAQERGQMFITPGTKVYEGMVVGQNAKAEDLEVNVCREKKLTNHRSKGDGVFVGLDAPRDMTLEDSIEYLGEDELLEVTPKSLRIRKKYLKAHERKRQEQGK